MGKESLEKEKIIYQESVKEKLKAVYLTGEDQEIEQFKDNFNLKERIGRKRIKVEGITRINWIVTKKLEIILPFGEKIDLRKELSLPPNVVLVRNEYNKEDEEIELIPLLNKEGKIKGYLLKYGFLEKPGNFLSLLHEIGHLKTGKKIKEKINKASIKVVQEYESPQDEILDEDEVLFVPEEEKGPPRPLKRDKVEEYIRLVAKEERDAWAWALMVLRRLREKGVDLEPQLPHINDLKKIIDEHLQTYEEDYILRQGGPSKAKILNMFLRHKNN